MNDMRKISLLLFMILLAVVFVQAERVTVGQTSLGRDIDADFYLNIGYDQCPVYAGVDINDCGWSRYNRGSEETCYVLKAVMQVQNGNLIINHDRCTTLGETWRSSDEDDPSSYLTREQPPDRACCLDYDCTGW